MKNTQVSNCDKGYKNNCCCGCKYQLELFKHPFNNINKGKCTESTNMYVCIVEHDLKRNNKSTLFENKHGICEMHVKK